MFSVEYCKWAVALCLTFLLLLASMHFNVTVHEGNENTPTFNLNRFHFPTLNISQNYNHTTNHTFIFDLKLANTNRYSSIRYLSVNLTFWYVPANNAHFPLQLAKYTMPGFDQGCENATVLRDLVVAAQSRLPWFDDAARAVSGGSTVLFKVDLTARFKLKVVRFWYKSSVNEMDCEATVEVDGSGKKVGEDAVQFIQQEQEV